jgi:hypothetical protein
MAEENKDLDGFLGVEEQAAIEEPKQQPEPEPQAAEPAKEASEAEKPADEAEEHEGEPEGRLVPLKAVQDERRKREDWKEQAIRAQVERDTFKAQLEELKKAPPPPPPAVVQQQARQPDPIPPAPDATKDPIGYANWLEGIQFNLRLNRSEQALRAELGDADVNAKVELFKRASASNPRLQAGLQLHPDPYRWAYDQGVKIEKDQAEAAQRDAMLKEIGTDPKAYREKLLAELRAEVEATQSAAAAQKPTPAAPQFQSLANARNTQGRGAPVHLTSDVPLDAMFPQ